MGRDYWDEEAISQIPSTIFVAAKSGAVDETQKAIDSLKVVKEKQVQKLKDSLQKKKEELEKKLEKIEQNGDAEAFSKDADLFNFTFSI